MMPRVRGVSVDLGDVDRLHMSVSLSRYLSVYALLGEAVAGKHRGVPAPLLAEVRAAVPHRGHAALRPLADPKRSIMPDCVTHAPEASAVAAFWEWLREQHILFAQLDQSSLSAAPTLTPCDASIDELLALYFAVDLPPCAPSCQLLRARRGGDELTSRKAKGQCGGIVSITDTVVPCIERCGRQSPTSRSSSGAWSLRPKPPAGE